MDLGGEVINKFIEACSELGTVDKKPSVDGRFMSVVISPIKNK
jgi:translation initiation factor IF-3